MTRRLRAIEAPRRDGPARRFRRGLFVALSLASFLALAIEGAACLDTSPITVTVDAAPPPIVDALEEAQAGCYQCLHAPNQPGPGCGNEIAACEADKACKDSIDCTFEDGCWNLGTPAALIQCGLPCAERAGQTDVQVKLGAAVFACVQATCPGPCHLGGT